MTDFCYTPPEVVVHCRHLLLLSVHTSILVNATPKFLIGSFRNLVNIIRIMDRSAWSRYIPVQWFLQELCPLKLSPYSILIMQPCERNSSLVSYRSLRNLVNIISLMGRWCMRQIFPGSMIFAGVMPLET